MVITIYLRDLCLFQYLLEQLQDSLLFLLVEPLLVLSFVEVYSVLVTVSITLVKHNGLDRGSGSVNCAFAKLDTCIDVSTLCMNHVI